MATPPSGSTSRPSVPEGTLSLEELDMAIATPAEAPREQPLSLEELDAALEGKELKTKPLSVEELDAALAEEPAPPPSAPVSVEPPRPVVEIPATAPPAEKPPMSLAELPEGAAVSGEKEFGFLEPTYYETRKGAGAKRFDYAAYDTQFDDAVREARELYRKNLRAENPLLDEKELDADVREYEDKLRLAPRTRATLLALDQLQSAKRDQTLRSKLLSVVFPIPKRIIAPQFREDPDEAWRRIARGGPTQRLTAEEAGAPEMKAADVQRELRGAGDFGDPAEVLASLVNPDPEKNSAWITLKAATTATGVRPFAAWLGNKLGGMSDEDYKAYVDLDTLAERNPGLERAGELLDAKRKTEAEAQFDELSFNQLPRVMKPVAPDVKQFRKAFAEDPTRWMLDPQMRELAYHIQKASNDTQLQDVLDSMPQGVLKKIQPSVGLSRSRVGEAVDLYKAASTELYGSGTVGKTFQAAMVSNLYDEVQTSKGLVLRPSLLTHYMALAGVPVEALWEAKLPLGTTLGIVGSAVAGPGLRVVGAAAGAAGGAVVQKGLASVAAALGDSKTAAQLDNAYVPNKAGRDYMLASGAYDDALRSFGYDPSKKGSLRTEDLDWAGRVYANWAMPEYMGFGFLQTARLAGVEGGALSRGALGADVALDLLFMPEKYMASAAVGPTRSAVQAYRVSSLMPKGQKLAGAFAAAAPELSTRLRVVKAAVKEGKTFGQAMKEGTEAAENANAITATFLSARMGVDDAIRNGKNPMTLLEQTNPKLAESVRDVVRRAGFDPEASEGLLNETVDGINNAIMDGVDVGLRKESIGNKTGSRLMDNLRQSPEWKRAYNELDKLVQDGTFTPAERDAALSLHESAAHTWAAANDGTPQEFFAQTQIVTRLDAQGRPVGVFLQPSQLEYTSPLSPKQYMLIQEALDELPETVTAGQRTTLDDVVPKTPSVVEGVARVDATPDDIVFAHVQEKLLQNGEDIPELHLRSMLRLDDYAGADVLFKADLVEDLEIVGRTVTETAEEGAPFSTVRVFGPDGAVEAEAKIAGIVDDAGEETLLISDVDVPGGKSGVRPLMRQLSHWAGIRGFKKVAVAKTGSAAADTAAETALFFATGGNRAEAATIGGVEAAVASVNKASVPLPSDGFQMWSATGGRSPILDVLGLAGYSEKGGAFRGFVEREASTLRTLLGDRWTDDLLRNFSHSIDDTGRVRLTPAGVDQFDNALADYLTRPGRSPKLRGAMSDFYSVMQNLYLRARGIPEHATFVQMQLDSILRPDKLLRPKLAEMTERMMYRPQPVLYAGKTAAERMAKAAKRLKGASREAYKVVGRPNELRELLGVSKGTKTIPVTDLYGQAIAHVLTEHARNRIGDIVGTGINLKQVGTRSVVAANRVENVQKATAGRLDSMGLDVSQLAKTLSPDESFYDLSNNPSLRAAMQTFVEDMKGSWYSDYLPAEVTSPFFDGSRISTDAYNKMVLLLSDRLAGPGSFRSIAAEAAPVSVGYALQEVLLRNAREMPKAEALMNAAKETFVVPRIGEDILDPGVVEILENADRRYAEIPNIIRDATRRLRKEGSARELPEFVKELRSLAVPPISGNAFDKLVYLYDDYAQAVVPSAPTAGAVSIAAPKSDAHLVDLLLDLDDVQDAFSGFRPLNRDTVSDLELSAFQQGRLMRDKVFAALTDDEVLLLERAQAARSQVRGNAKISKAAEADIAAARGTMARVIDTLADEDKVVLSTVTNVLIDGISRRGDAVVERGTSIILASFGGEDAAQLLSLSQPSWKISAYRNFYTGNWEGIFDPNNYVGLAAHYEQAGQFATKYSQSTAGLAMIARMMALDIKSQLASDLIEYGVRADVSSLTKDMAFTALANRVDFTEKVKAYAQDILNFADAEVRVAGPESKAIYIPERPVVGAEDLAAYNKAQELISSYGLKIAPATLEQVLLPDGTRVIIPKVVADELNNALLRNSDVQGAYSLAKKLKLTRTPEGENLVEVVMTDAQRAEKWREETRKNVGTAFGASLGAVLGFSVAAGTGGVAVGALAGGLAARNATRVLDKIVDLMPATYRQMNIGMTVGIGMAVHPAYMVANFFGGFFQSHLGIGPVQTTSMLLRNPRQTAAVMMELFAGDKFAISAPPLITKDGRIYSMRRLASALDAQGLSGSFLKSETALSMVEDIRQNEATFWNTMARPGRWSQQTVIDAAAGVDNFWRVNVALDELSKGASLAEAAKMARTIAFDYSRMTEREKTYIRKFVMFYAFMRRNIDLFYDTAMRYPERVLSQMRTISNANYAVLGEDRTLVAPDYVDGRLLVYARKTLRDAMDNKQVAIMFPQVPINDALGLMYSTVAFPLGEEPTTSVVTKLNPLLQSPFVYAMNRDFFSGRELSGPNAYNPVPAHLVEWDQNVLGGIISSILDIEWRPAKDPSKANSPEYMGYYQANNGFAWWMMRNVVQNIPGVPFGAGRALSTGESWDRAGVGLIESVVEASQYYRENLRNETVNSVLQETANLIGERMRDRPKPNAADMYIQKGDYDKMVTPREGLSRADELLSLMGIRAIRLSDPTLATHELYYEATQELKPEKKELRKAQAPPKQ